RGERLRHRDTRLCGPHTVLRWNLCGYINPFGAFSDESSNQFFTVTIPINQGGVDEVQTQIHGSVQGPERLVVRSANPAAFANPPGPITDFRDIQACLTECSVVHSSIFVCRS